MPQLNSTETNINPNRATTRPTPLVATFPSVSMDKARSGSCLIPVLTAVTSRPTVIKALGVKATDGSVPLGELKIGPLVWNDLRMGIGNTQQIEQVTGHPIDGLLGGCFMSWASLAIRLDYPPRRLPSGTVTASRYPMPLRSRSKTTARLFPCT